MSAQEALDSVPLGDLRVTPALGIFDFHSLSNRELAGFFTPAALSVNGGEALPLATADQPVRLPTCRRQAGLAYQLAIGILTC